MITPVKKSRIYQDIVDQIQKLIAEGKFKVGDQLPPERELAERFMVSRTSVREALQTLELMGLLESKHGSGRFVKAVTIDSIVQPLASVLVARADLMMELLDARKMFEPAIARFAAERANAEDIAEMEEILEEQAKKVEDGGTAIAEDTAFHAAIATATKNEVVLRMVRVITDLLEESRERSLQLGGRPSKSLQGHRRILAAIKKGDGEAARTAMLAHLEEIEGGILERLDFRGPAGDENTSKDDDR
ncbi:MAG: FadR/GntR family transcriptional regulator [Syntrophothermus sp.]